MELLLRQLLTEFNIEQNKNVDNTVLKLVDNAKIAQLSKSISSIKQQIIDIFIMYRTKEDFKEKHIVVPNAHVKKGYIFAFDLQDFPDIILKEIRNLERAGLQFDAATNQITGTPSIASTIDLQVVFYNQADENKSEDIKIIPFIINADPKDLWKDTPSDKNLKYAKADNDTFSGTFLDRKIVVASRRGRSHAHEGLFRDDHFCVRQLQEDWAIVAVADGAGSARYSRQGSKMATEYIAEDLGKAAVLTELDALLNIFFAHDAHEASIPEAQSPGISKEERQLKAKSSIINILYKSVRTLHTMLNDFAQQESIHLKDLNTTLIFALVRKTGTQYDVLTFGVGDCPINIITEHFERVQLLNILDVGEFGGGTRFITMPEIFNNPNMGARFAINRFNNFFRLFLMTDGIYDPKFVTENKLEDMDTWQHFTADLEGANEDGTKVDFENDLQIKEQLLKWMDFWSKGNHDDRTLAIIY